MIKKIINNEIFSYLVSSGVSFVTDILLFYILVNLFSFLNDYSIVISAILARCISSFINYLLNRNYVFKENNKKNKIDKKTFFQYYLLVIIQLTISTSLVLVFKHILKLDVTLIKIVIDIMIFIVNYLIQKIIIFKKKQ